MYLCSKLVMAVQCCSGLFVAWFWGTVLHNCKTNLLQFKKSPNMPIWQRSYDYNSWTISAVIVICSFLWLSSLNFKGIVTTVIVALVPEYFLANRTYCIADFQNPKHLQWSRISAYVVGGPFLWILQFDICYDVSNKLLLWKGGF